MEMHRRAPKRREPNRRHYVFNRPERLPGRPLSVRQRPRRFAPALEQLRARAVGQSAGAKGGELSEIRQELVRALDGHRTLDEDRPRTLGVPDELPHLTERSPGSILLRLVRVVAGTQGIVSRAHARRARAVVRPRLLIDGFYIRGARSYTASAAAFEHFTRIDSQKRIHSVERCEVGLERHPLLIRKPLRHRERLQARGYSVLILRIGTEVRDGSIRIGKSIAFRFRYMGERAARECRLPVPVRVESLDVRHLEGYRKCLPSRIFAVVCRIAPPARSTFAELGVPPLYS